MKHIFKPLALLISIAVVSSLITACESEKRSQDRAEQTTLKSTETQTKITSEQVTTDTPPAASVKVTQKVVAAPTHFDDDPHQINKDIYANMVAFQKMVEQYHFHNDNYPPDAQALYADAQTNKYFTYLENPINYNIQWNAQNSAAEGIIAFSSPEGNCEDNPEPDAMYPVAAGTLRYWVTENGYAIRACGAEENSGFLSSNGTQVILAGGDMAIE